MRYIQTVLKNFFFMLFPAGAMLCLAGFFIFLLSHTIKDIYIRYIKATLVKRLSLQVQSPALWGLFFVSCLIAPK